MLRWRSIFRRSKREITFAQSPEQTVQKKKPMTWKVVNRLEEVAVAVEAEREVEGEVGEVVLYPTAVEA
jgi:hypothetical protein